MAEQTKVEIDPAAQDIMGMSTAAPEPNPETIDALDKLREEQQKQKQQQAEASLEVKAKDDAGTPPPPEKKDDAGTPPPPEKKDDAGTPPPPEKKEGIEDIDLPPEAKPKSHEAFSRVKEWARKEVEDREEQIKALKTKVEELSGKPELSDEVKTELEELRRFRATFDVEADPSFKAYDEKITRADEFIYSQLRKSPNVTEDVIKQIKEYGGPSKVQMEKILEAIPDQGIVRAVNAKLADIEATKFDKEQALADAKKNADKFVEERRQQWQDAAVAHNTATKEQLTGIFENLSWVRELKPKDGASEDAVKAAADHNAFVTNVRKELEAALQDDSPRMRAALLAGMAQLFYANRVSQTKDAQIKSLEKSLAAAQAKIEKLQNASVSRLRGSQAIGDPSLTKSKGPNYNETSGEALDRYRREMFAARQT